MGPLLVHFIHFKVPAEGAVPHTYTQSLSQRCLRKVRSRKIEDLELEYGFPDNHRALALKNRSIGERMDRRGLTFRRIPISTASSVIFSAPPLYSAMLEHGFEYALTEGYPRNPNPWRYRCVLTSTNCLTCDPCKRGYM